MEYVSHIYLFIMSYVWKHKHTMLETLEAETGRLKVQDQPRKLETLFQNFLKICIKNRSRAS